MEKAWNRIEHKEGNIVGNNGCVYLRETYPYVSPGGPKFRKALFKCEFCGKEFESIINSVRTNKTRSCGCYSIFVTKRTNTKHGLYKDRLHAVRTILIGRCYNKNNWKYKDYGGRGIIVCNEWRNDFKAFYDYIMSLPHAGEPGYSIDRYPDNNGNYEQSVKQRKYKNNKSGYVGVCFRPDINKWVAYITINKKRIHIGHYNTPEEAVASRNNYIIENELWEYPIQEIKKMTA